jgi:hypothetical protein
VYFEMPVTTLWFNPQVTAHIADNLTAIQATTQRGFVTVPSL